MSRGTFSHTKLKNLMKNHTKSGPYTTHQPSGVVTTIFEASTKYREDRISLVVVAGNNFGRGTARDWATKVSCSDITIWKNNFFFSGNFLILIFGTKNASIQFSFFKK